MVSKEITAQRFFDQVQTAMERLTADPDSYPLLRPGFHGVRVSRFPFVLVYQIRPRTSAFVVAVAHTSRRSGSIAEVSAPR
jgi:plasmid stabilization system protein ParE